MKQRVDSATPPPTISEFKARARGRGWLVSLSGDLDLKAKLFMGHSYMFFVSFSLTTTSYEPSAVEQLSRRSLFFFSISIFVIPLIMMLDVISTLFPAPSLEEVIASVNKDTTTHNDVRDIDDVLSSHPALAFCERVDFVKYPWLIEKVDATKPLAPHDDNKPAVPFEAPAKAQNGLGSTSVVVSKPALHLLGQVTVEPLQVLYNPEVERRRQVELLPLPVRLSPAPVGSRQASRSPKVTSKAASQSPHSPAVALPRVHHVSKATPPLPVIALPDVPRVPISTSQPERSPSHELLWCDPVVAGVNDAMTLTPPQQVRVATPVQNCQPFPSGSSWKVQNGQNPIHSVRGFKQHVSGSKQNVAVSKQHVSAPKQHTAMSKRHVSPPKQIASSEQSAASLERIAAVQKQNAAVMEQNAAISRRKAASGPKQSAATSRQNVPAPKHVPSRQSKAIHPSPLRDNYVAPETGSSPTIRTPPTSFIAPQHSQMQGTWAAAPAQIQQMPGFLRYTGVPVGFPVPAVQTEVRPQIALPRRASPPGFSYSNAPTSSVPAPVVAAQTQGFQGYITPVTASYNVGPVISLPVIRQDVQVTADPCRRASWVQMLSEQNAAVSSQATSVPSSSKRRAPPDDRLPPSKKARVAKSMRTGVHATYRSPQVNTGTQSCPIYVR